MSNKSIFTPLGASNHTSRQRPDGDYYATDPAALDGLLQHVTLPHKIWEPCCGAGHLSRRLTDLGHEVISSDIADRGFGSAADFFTAPLPDGCSCIVTNPPYNKANKFIRRALDILPDGGLLCLFLKTLYLEGRQRYENIFRHDPPQLVLQCVSRVLCALNGDFDTMRKAGGSAVAYAWFVWHKGFHGDPAIKWINIKQQPQ